MLSYKVTYAIQILDLLRQNNEGMSLLDIQSRFIFLPSKSFISGIIKQLEVGRLICNASPHRGTRYYIMSNLNDVTLDDLVRIIHDELVLDTHVGFIYWQAGYLKDHPNIIKIEQQLEDKMTEIMKSVTIGKLLGHEKREIKYIKLQGDKMNSGKII